MQYRALGKEPIKLSVIAFGTGDNAGTMVHGSSREQTELVAHALELGINLFDTSAAYGRGAAEVNIGRVLRDLGAADAHVATKAFIHPSDLGRIGAKVAESLDDSLFRLRRDHVDVLLLHNPIRHRPNPENPLITALTSAQVINEALPVMVKAREQGKARVLGLACDESETSAVLPVLESGEFAMINFTYNLANPTAARPLAGVPDSINFDGLFAAAERYGAAVAVVRPLAGGALAGSILAKGLAGIHDRSRGYFRMLPQVHEPMIRIARRFAFLDRPGEQTIAEAAYRYILSDARVATVIGGFSDVTQMADAIAAVEAGPLSTNDRARIEAAFVEGY